MNAATLRRQPLRGSPRRLLARKDLHHPRRFPAALRRAMPTRPAWPEKPDPSPAAAARMRREIQGADSPNSAADPSAPAGRIASSAAAAAGVR